MNDAFIRLALSIHAMFCAARRAMNLVRILLAMK
jgi:hypothetical protein